MYLPSFHAVVGSTLYMFGGSSEAGFSNSLFKLNLDTLEWQLAKQDPLGSPTAKFLGGMVAFGNRLVTFGGTGVEEGFTESHGATFLANQNFGQSGSGWNNALHEYNIDTGEYMLVSGLCMCMTQCSTPSKLHGQSCTAYCRE